MWWRMQFVDSSLNTITIGARSSRLSRAQVEEVCAEIRHHFPSLRFEPFWVETTGDRNLAISLRELDKTDFFTKEIDAMQLAKICRITVHSAKDLPDPLPLGLCIAALTRGQDNSDVLVLRDQETLSTLLPGAKIGVSSERRETAIHSLRPDLVCVDIRGSIDQRLELLIAGRIDGLVVAEAALIRLQLTQVNRLPLPGKTAPMQGKLAILAREDDKEMKTLFACIDTR
jgi:hydroxymethylbilane synthase